MGVHGLWRLLDSFGEVTTPEEWRGRRVAIDASIWMAQFRSMCAPGEDAEQKILEGFFVRILKLIFYDIKPLFVFDGTATVSKTTEHRRRQKARQALALATLKRRARQIVYGQVSSGVLNIHELAAGVENPVGVRAEAPPLPPQPPQPHEVPLDAAEAKLGLPDSAEAGTVENKRGASEPAVVLRKRVRHGHAARRHGRRSRRRVAPEAVSRAVTGAFLDDAEAVLQERAAGEQRVLQNSLRFTSTALFMGPRRAIEETAMQREEAFISDESVVTVETTPTTSCRSGDDDISEDVQVFSGSDSESVVMVAEGAHRSPARIRTGRAREGSVAIVSPTPTFSLSDHPPPAALKLRGLSSPSPDNDAGHSALQEINRLLGKTAPLRQRQQQEDGWEKVEAGEEEEEEEEEETSTSSEWSESDTTSDSGDWDGARFRLRDADLWNPSTQLPHGKEATVDAEEDDEDADFTPVPLPMQSVSQTEPPAAAANDEEASKPSIRWWEQNRAGGGGGAARRAVPFELLDIVTLLECFGIPFCLSPSEADAQCAYLSQAGVVDAVFTEDSDVVVHGGTVVLRGFFSNSKQVVEYRQTELTACGLDKRVLVALALLLGCDYTEGVAGIGVVGALRALAACWVRRAPLPSDGARSRHVYDEDDQSAQPEFVCALLTRWRELVRHPSDSWETGDKDVSILQYLLLSRQHSEWASLGVADFEPPLSAAALFYTPEVDRSIQKYEAGTPNWPELRAFAASRGLLGSSWVVQRFELAQKANAEQEASAREQDTQQRRLTDFGVQNRVRERWAYKKLSPKYAQVLENLREMRQRP